MATSVCFFIPKRIPTTDWRVEAPVWAHGMLATLRLNTPSGEISIHNVYRNTNLLVKLNIKLNMKQLIRECCGPNSVLLGDFNLHHKLWAGSNVTTCKDSRALADAVRSYDLHLCNTPGVITYTRSADPAGRSRSTIDLTFLGPHLTHRLLGWSVVDVQGFDSDHRVLRTTLDCPPVRQISIHRRWHETDIEAFRTSVERNLGALPQPDLESTAGIDAGLWEIFQIMEKAIEEHVPYNDRCEPNAESGDARQQTYKEAVTSTTAGDPENTQRWAKRARMRAQPTQSPFTPDFHYKNKIAKTGGEKADMYMDAVYGAGKTSRKRTSHPKLPRINDTSLPLGQQLTRMVPGDAENQGEVLKSINSLPDRKATGVGIIGNEALKMVGDIITPYLEDIFDACLSKNHYPGWLKFSRTILFHKTGKPDHLPTSYRPIALLTSIGKVLERIILSRIKEALLSCAVPLRQFGGLSGKSTTAALNNLINFVLTGFAKGQKVSVLGLDISGAFPHVDRDELVQMLVDKGVPGYLIGIIWSWLCDRRTLLEIPGHEGELFFENGGLPQGSCLSPFLFLVFAAPLFDVDSMKINAIFSIFAFVDDTYITVRSFSFEKNCEVIEKVHSQILEWSRGNGVSFDPGKYGLLHFLQDRGPIVTIRPSIDDLPPNEVLFKEPYLDILGVRVDNRLSWKYHIDCVTAKVSKKLRCLKQISGSTWGPDLERMRVLYNSQIRSIISSASPAWFITGLRPQKQGTLSVKLVNDLDRLQTECLLELSGAMKNTGADVLRKELYISRLSTYLQMRTIAHFAKHFDSPNYRALRQDRARALSQSPWELLNDHLFEQLDRQASHLINSAKARLEYHHGKDEMMNRWSDEDKRARAIEKMALQTVHAQCSSEWQQFKDSWDQTHSWAKPLALAEPWGPRSLRYHEGLSRKESTMLLHCRTGHIGLAAFLHRIGSYPSDSCPLCGNGRHTVEHLFVHCTGRDCTGRDMAKRRATLHDRTGGLTNLHAIFAEYPDEAARFAIKTFGIPQFTRASWQTKAARATRKPLRCRRRQTGAAPAGKRRGRYRLLVLRGRY